jgi:hypothetical protein
MQFFKKQTDHEPTEKELQAEKEADEKAQLAYINAKGERRIENAKLAGQRDADRLANQKPFYQKVINLASNVGKDLVKASNNVNPDALISFDKPTQTKTKRHRRKKK